MVEKNFHPVQSYSWTINRAERSRQVRWLALLLEIPEGRVWFLKELQCPCDEDQALTAELHHLCFPLRDVFTADFYQCRGNSELEDQFIAYYNELFGFPVYFGVEEIWRTAPGNEIRHPAAPGRAGWYEAFLRGRIADDNLYEHARNVRRLLGTEADLLILTSNFVVLIECKYLSALSMEQHERHLMMGETLARRLGKNFHFGLVVKDKRDPKFSEIEAPYVLWSDIQEKLYGLLD